MIIFENSKYKLLGDKTREIWIGIEEIIMVMGFFRFHHFFLVLFSLIAILTSSVCSAQIKASDFNNYTHYTEENGLLSSYITEICEDKYGFLWIATGKGVSRFDGNQFTNYNYYFDNLRAAEIGFVENLIIDDLSENIWIGSENGIFYSAINDVKFRKITSLNSSISFSIDGTKDFFMDDHHRLWATNDNKGLLSLDINESGRKQFSFNYNRNGDTKLNSLQCLAQDPNNSDILWIGTLAGLIRFNMSTNDYQVYVYGNNPELSENKIREVHVSNQEVFLGTWASGMIVFDKQSGHFRNPLKDIFPNSYTLILGFYKGKNTNLWITSDEGVIQYNVNSKNIIKVLPNNLSSGLINGVSYIDSRGIMWFCHTKGLFKFDPFQSQNTFIELEKRNSLQNPLLVREIIQWDDFVYIAGQGSSGLYKVNLNDHSFKTIDLSLLSHREEKGYNIHDMVKMEDGSFLVLSSPILIFNPKTERFKVSPLQIDHPYPSLATVVKDKNNTYWVGTREGGLYNLNFRNYTVTNYRKEFDEFQVDNHRWIESLYIDSMENLWIRTAKYLSVMDLKDYAIQNFSSGKHQFIYEDVGEFLEDSKGKVWITGKREGIGFMNLNKHFGGISHKTNGYFKKLYKYNDSIFWTVGKNLGRFNINSMSHNEIELSSNDEKLRVSGPIISTVNENFIIGYNNGILIYNPEKQKINQKLTIPYIRKIVSSGKTLYEGNNLTKNNFTFDAKIKHLTLMVSSLDFQLSDQITYKYKIDGDWQNIDVGDEINLTNLSHGDYKIKIKACTSVDNYYETFKEYSFTILTPWFLSWWAYIIYLCVAVLFGDRLYRFQLSKQLAVAESKRLKEIDDLKNALYANITHEFRTPLTVILGMVESLRSNFKKKVFDDVDKPLEMIHRNGENLLQLVNQMLDLAKLDSGNMELQLILSDIIPFVKYICESFNSMAKQKQINLTVYSEIDSLIMDFDSDKLSSVISNLLSNAIKFTSRRGKIIVHLNHLTNNEEYFFIKIKDNGLGLSEKEIGQVFNRFYQTDSSSSRKNEGSGIGLSLIKELVTLMQGTINVKSKPDQGSEFIVQIPVTRNASVTENTFKSITSPITTTTTRPVQKLLLENDNELPIALIIEDNEDVAHYLKMCLKGKYETLYANNGKVGIEMAYENIPDIVICDVMMPEKDGYEVCSALKEDERTDHIPFIILTARITLKDRIKGLSHGADAYLAKPFNKTELFIRLDQLVLTRKKMIAKFEANNFNQFLSKRVTNPKTKFIKKIIGIIHSDLDNHSFGSSELAKKLWLSESQTYRKIKAITGKSTAIFIRSVRLQKAKELIKTSDRTISEIAYDVGFNNISWFSRTFKEEFGITPSDLK